MSSYNKFPQRFFLIFLIACLILAGLTQFFLVPGVSQAAIPAEEDPPYTSITLSPSSAGTLANVNVSIDFPANSVDKETIVDLYALETSLNATEWRGESLTPFLVRADDGSGEQVELLLNATVTMIYNEPADVSQESLLKLFYWQEIPGEWQEVGALCSSSATYKQDTAANQISVESCVLGEFALMADVDKPSFAYMPFAGFQNAPSYSVSGQVIDEYGSPVQGVQLDAGSPYYTTTDLNGEYVLNNLNPGVYTLNLRRNGYAFPDSGNTIDVYNSQTGVNFTAALAPGCYEEVVNGKFEKDKAWHIHGSRFPAGYSTWEAHKGLRSMRTGIFHPWLNTYSYSVFSQYVDIPTATVAVTLTFWIYQDSTEYTTAALSSEANGLESSDEVLAGDVNYVKLLDTNHNTLATLMQEKDDVDAWVKYTFLLEGFDGQRLQLVFGTYNDGEGGVTGMFVDDVSLVHCVDPGTIPPAPVEGCNTNIVTNPKFEKTNGWVIRNSQYIARYTTAKAHSNKWSMLAGITSKWDNTYSFSIFTQSIKIPSVATSALMDYWIYATTTESANAVPLAAVPTGEFDENSPQAMMAGDAQYLAIKDAEGTLHYILWQRADTDAWENLTADLTPYAGQTVELRFGVYNDGDGGVTAMYVDDVYVNTVCP
ncbi:MAG: carboxypeptidase regulatory-like domain-containing protein [Anaerolineales bacterium]|nr:carboxypeptidase regulatory-like domain-containing protein [Anaerolineales bacterium]